MLNFSPLTGFEAFRKCIERITPDGGKLWLKVGHNLFLIAETNPSGRFPIHWSRLEKRDDPLSRVKSKQCHDAYQTISEFCTNNDGGAFFIQGKPTDYPLSKFCLESNDVVAEMDDGTADDQWKRINHFISGSGLVPDLVISSGGKSLHPHWRLDKDYPTAQVVNLKRLIVIALISDPVTVSPHQPVRIAGFDRKEKNSHQSLLAHSDCKYTYSEFIEGFKRYFDSLGWKFPETITDDWWRDTLRPIVTTTNTASREEKLEQLKQVLAVGLEGYQSEKEKQAKERELKRQKRQLTGITGQTDLVSLIEDASEKLGSDAFDWGGHNWKWSGNKARGCCPFHESKSGTSAWIAPSQKRSGQWGFACYQCTDNRQITPFTYWWYLKYGLNASYPTGKDFIEASKEFLAENGITVPQPQWESYNPSEPDPKKYREKCKQSWVNSKKFTPDKVIDNNPFIDFDIEIQNLILCLKAGLGSGKTTLLLKWLHTIFKEDNCIGLGYRNSLILQTIEKHNAPLIQTIEQLENEGKWDEARHLEKQLFNFLQKDGVIHNGLCLKVWSCIESAHHYSLSDFNDCVLILDEVTSVIKSLLFSSTVRKRAEKIELFYEAVKRAKVVICLDGNLSDMYSDFLGKVDPSKKLLKVAAKNNIEPPKIKLLEGVLKEDEIKKKDYSLWLHQLFNVPETVCVASDSQILLESLDNMLKEQGRKGLRIDSTTISDEDVKEFMRNPDKWIKENNPDYILYSPTSESGLSIDIKGYFQSFYGFLFGVLDVDSSLQIIRRLRDISVKNYLWVNDFFINNEDTIRSPLPDVVEFYQRQLITRDLALILDDRVDIQSELLQYIQNALITDINKLSTRIMAQRNYEKGNFRECVYWALEQAGYDISDQITPEFDEDLQTKKDELRDEKKAVKLKKSDDIFNASDEFIGKSHTVIEWDAGYEKQCAIKKARLIDRLPEIQNSGVWSPDFIYQTLYRFPYFISQLETRYLLLNPEKSERISQEKYHFNLMQGRRGKQLTPWKLKPIHLKVKTLQKIGIFDFIDEVKGEELTAESEPVERLFNICQKKAIWQALGRKPSIDRIKYVRWLLNQIGYDLNSSKVKRDGRVINIYTVASSPHKDLGSLITPILDAIARRYDKDTDELNWDKKVIQVEPVARKQDEKSKVKKSDEKIAKTLNTSSLEQVDDPGQFVIQKTEERQPDKMLQNPSEDENKYLELDPDFIQWVDHAETKDHFNDLLGILWGVSQQNEALYHSMWHRTFNAISQEARERINYWLSG